LTVRQALSLKILSFDKVDFHVFLVRRLVKLADARLAWLLAFVFFVVLVSSAHLRVEPGVVCSMALLLAFEAKAFIEALLSFLRREGTINVHSIRIALADLRLGDVPVPGRAYRSVVGHNCS
jgi:hypothetical protein